MKILGKSIIPQNQMAQTRVNYQPSFSARQDSGTFDKFDLNQDGVENPFQKENAKKILENPVLLEKFQKFMASAFLRLVGAAYSDSQPVVQEDTEAIISEKDKEIETLKNEISKLKKQNQETEMELTTSFDEAHTNIGKVAESDESVIEQSEDRAEHQYEKIEFPKRKVRGQLNREQKQLKVAFESLDIPEDMALKLKSVCEKLIQKDAQKEDILTFAQQLIENKNNIDEISKTIDSAYIKFCTEEQTSPKDNDEPQTTTEKKQSGVVIKGKVNLDKIEPHRKPYNELIRESLERRAKYAQEQQNTSSEANAAQEVSSQGEPEKPQENNDSPNNYAVHKRPRIRGEKVDIESIAEAKPEKIESPYVNKNAKFYYEIPEERKKYIRETGHAIKQIICHFKSIINPRINPETGETNPPIPWLSRHVLRDDVITERVMCAELERFMPYPEHQYQNLKRTNVHEFVDILNSEDFQDLFTLHSAMRLIDRYVDFKSDVPYEKQCQEIVQGLKETIEIALNNGVNFSVYEDTFTDKDKLFDKKVYKGVSIAVPPEYFSKNTKKYFKNKPFIVTFCDQAQDQNFRLGAISTIYTPPKYVVPQE